MSRVALPALVAVLVAPAAAEEMRGPAELERLVLQDCGSCHGLTLKGGLGPDIRPQAIGHYEHKGLEAVILDGIPGTAMPPWRPLLSDAEAAWIAEFLLTGGPP